MPRATSNRGPSCGARDATDGPSEAKTEFSAADRLRNLTEGFCLFTSSLARPGRVCVERVSARTDGWSGVAPGGRFANTPGCGRCPQLAGGADRDLSRRVWERRAAAFAKIPADRLTFVAPSRWLADEVRRSSLCGRFPTEVIPNPVDTDTFRPRDRAAAQDVLGVPADARVALFVADGLGNPRKGFDLLIGALEHLRDVPNLFLLALGGGSAAVPAGVPHRAVGSVADDRFLSFAYSAADVFVIPTRADNLPNTILESMACGTPCVGFAVGGVPDMIRPGETGLLAEPFDVGELADAVRTVLQDDDLRVRMSADCRRAAEAEYPLSVQAGRYVDLYRRVTGAGNSADRPVGRRRGSGPLFESPGRRSCVGAARS